MTMAGDSGGIGLEYLSVFGMPLGDFAALAGRIGCQFISVNFGRPANPLTEWSGVTLRESAPLRALLASAAAAHGLRIEQVEGFAILPETDVSSFARDLDAVAAIGARSICAIAMDRDLPRMQAQFALLASLAAERGVMVTTEVGAGTIRTFEKARATWTSVSHPNFRLLIDAMHFFRFGGVLEDLRNAPDSMIGHVQLCDVPMPALTCDYMAEALFERLAPGEGSLPLEAMLATFSQGVPIGLEIPMRSLSAGGRPSEEALRECVGRTERMIRKVSMQGTPKPDDIRGQGA